MEVAESYLARKSASDMTSLLLQLFLLELRKFSGFLKDQVVDYAGRIAIFLQLSFEAGH